MFCCGECEKGSCAITFACGIALVAFEVQHGIHQDHKQCCVAHLDTAVELYRRLRDVPDRTEFWDLIPLVASLPEDLSAEMTRIIGSIVLRLDPEKGPARTRLARLKIAQERHRLRRERQLVCPHSVASLTPQLASVPHRK
jgi:hypothetical protein